VEPLVSWQCADRAFTEEEEEEEDEEEEVTW
jgi:hypothetical protein